MSQPKCFSCPDKQKMIKKNESNKHCRYMKCMLNDKNCYFVLSNFCLFVWLHPIQGYLCSVHFPCCKTSHWSCYVYIRQKKCIKSLYMHCIGLPVSHLRLSSHLSKSPFWSTVSRSKNCLSALSIWFDTL